MLKSSKLFFVGIIFLFCLDFFSFQGLDSFIYPRIHRLAIIILFIIVLLQLRHIKNRSSYCSYYYVAFFFLYPFVNAISCQIANGQSLYSTLISIMPHLVIIIYFFFVANKIKESDLLKIVVAFSIIRTFLTIIEQFTYPEIWFAFRTDYNGFGEYWDIKRNGIYRFLIADAYYLPLFVAFYSYAKTKICVKPKMLIILIASLVGLYLDQTRQVLASFFISIIVTNFISSKQKFKYVVFVCIFLFFLINYLYLIVGKDMLETTIEQLDINSDKNIRILSYTYYLSDLTNPITILFGNGFADFHSSYGKEIEALEMEGLYRCDIGVIGALHMMGVAFVSAFFLYYYKVIFKNWQFVDRPLQMMSISILTTLPMIFPLYNSTLSGMECFLGIFIFLIDKSIIKNKVQITANHNYCQTHN